MAVLTGSTGFRPDGSFGMSTGSAPAGTGASSPGPSAMLDALMPQLRDMFALKRKKAEMELDAMKPRIAAPQLGARDPYTERLKSLNLEDAIAQTEAKTGAAPMKIVGSPSTGGGFATQDPNAMNAYQRQAFMPQASREQPATATPGQMASALEGDQYTPAGRRRQASQGASLS